MEPSIKEWTAFLDRCLSARVRPDQFVKAAAQLQTTCPLPASILAVLILRPPKIYGANVCYDIRVVLYLEKLLAEKRIDASDLLAASFHYSNDRPSKPDQDVSKERRCNPPEVDEILFTRVQKAFQTEERPLTNSEGVRTLFVVTRWMQAMVTSHTSDSMIQAIAGIQQQPQQQSINNREALGVLMVGIVENAKMLRILNHPTCKGRRYQLPPILQRPMYSKKPAPHLLSNSGSQELLSSTIFLHRIPFTWLHWIAEFIANCQSSRNCSKAARLP